MSGGELKNRIIPHLLAVKATENSNADRVQSVYMRHFEIENRRLKELNKQCF